MAEPTIEERARALYDACPTPKPNWDHLGEVTRSVWRERVAPHGSDALPSPAEAAPPESTEYEALDGPEVTTVDAEGQMGLF